MNTFWLKVAGFAVVVVGLLILVSVFSSSESEPKPEPKTIYDQWEEDEKRLRAEPVAEQPKKTEQIPVTSRRPRVEEPAEPVKRQFKKLSEIDDIEAERLFNVAIQSRKMGRLPGPGYKLMVDTCRQIIEKHPDSIWAFKAKRMLADIPERYRERYHIADEEIKY